MSGPDTTKINQWSQLGISLNSLAWEGRIFVDGQLVKVAQLAYGFDDVWTLYDATSNTPWFTLFIMMAGAGQIEKVALMSIANLKFYNIALSDVQMQSIPSTVPWITGTVDDTVYPPKKGESLAVIVGVPVAVVGVILVVAALLGITLYFRRRQRILIEMKDLELQNSRRKSNFNSG
jgi:hypothetical protein